MSTAEVIAHAKSPRLLAWLRQAQGEISRCRHVSIVWHARDVWRGVARGLHMASAIEVADRDLLDKSIDEFVEANIETLNRQNRRIDEE